MKFRLPVLVLLVGCSTGQHTTPPKASVTTAGGTVVTQSGSAESPTAVNTANDVVVVPLPADSHVTVTAATATAPATITVDLKAPSSLQLNSKRESVIAPKAFTPPAPPSQKELAEGDAVRKNWWVSALCLVAAGLLARRTHFTAAIILGVTAVAFPIIMTFIGALTAYAVGIGLVCIAGGLFWGWHILNDRKLVVDRPTPTPIPTQ